jgi:hypothetical protein
MAGAYGSAARDRTRDHTRTRDSACDHTHECTFDYRVGTRLLLRGIKGGGGNGAEGGHSAGDRAEPRGGGAFERSFKES